MFILQIKVPRALTGLNSCTHFRILPGWRVVPCCCPMTSAVVFLNMRGQETMTVVKVSTIRSM
jgi:hypothetical protein